MCELHFDACVAPASLAQLQRAERAERATLCTGALAAVPSCRPCRHADLNSGFGGTVPSVPSVPDTPRFGVDATVPNAPGGPVAKFRSEPTFRGWRSFAYFAPTVHSASHAADHPLAQQALACPRAACQPALGVSSRRRDMCTARLYAASVLSFGACPSIKSMMWRSAGERSLIWQGRRAPLLPVTPAAEARKPGVGAIVATRSCTS